MKTFSRSMRPTVERHRRGLRNLHDGGRLGVVPAQLRNSLEMVDIADQAESLIDTGTLDNPVA